MLRFTKIIVLLLLCSCFFFAMGQSMQKADQRESIAKTSTDSAVSTKTRPLLKKEGEAIEIKMLASVFSVAGLTEEQRIAVEVLEGLANRKGPSLILSDSAYWSDGAWNRKWIEIYSKQYDIRFKEINGLMDLLKAHRNDYEGLVVYDPIINGSVFVALTVCGIENHLPVADPKPYVDQLGLKVVHDFRGKFKDSIEAYQWALDNVMPRCNRQYAHIPAGPDVDGKYIGWGFEGYDYCIMNKGFFFNLSFSENDKKSFQDRTIQGDQRQAAMYRKILTSLKKPAFIVGYGEPEIDWFALIGEYGHQYVHWGDNLSFHAVVTPKNERPKQKKHFTPENTQLDEDKYYVCFVMSEGDSMKGPVPFFFNSWFEKERGNVPITWTIPHQAMRKFPAMLEYFYNSATANDYFAGCQVPNFALPNLEEYAAITKENAEAADLTCICGAFNFPSDKVMAAKEKFFDIVKPLGVWDIVYEDCPDFGYQKFIGKKRDIPMVGTAFIMGYWHRMLGGWDVKWQQMLKDPNQYPGIVDKLSAEIAKIADHQKPPFVIIVYGDLHAYDEHSRFYHDVAKKLDSQRFKVVRLDEAFSAIRKWNKAKGD